MTRGTCFAVAAFAAALTASSCRSITAPDTTSAGTSRQARLFVRDDAARGAARTQGSLTGTETAQVPIVRTIEAFSDANGLHVRIRLAPETFGDDPFYGPRTVGGWQFQMFLNVDRERTTGYWDGFEYLTRDSEQDLEAGTLVLRRTEGGGGPGGWGPEAARIPVQIASRLVTFTVPLDAIADDGIVDFGLELYATVAGGEDGVTPVASFVRYYEGSSSPRRPRTPGDPEPVVVAPVP